MLKKLKLIDSKFNLVNKVHLQIGKITHLSNYYTFSEDCPSNYNEDVLRLAYKINGTIIYGYENEPEISERFYMIRWWDN